MDDAFPFRVNIMKPYTFKNLTIDQLIYSYMLSRSRHVVEIVSRILVIRLHVFWQQFYSHLKTAENYKLCVTDNYLIKKSTQSCTF